MTTPTPHDYDELLICLDIAASMAGDPRPRSTFAQAAAAIRSLHSDLAAAQEALRKQGQSALMGMDAVHRVANHELTAARQLHAQSNPAALDDARALNERLTNELEAAQEAIAQCRALYNETIQRAVAAEALAESYRQDAERYRWLREHSWLDTAEYGAPQIVFGAGYQQSSPIILDAAIDAAIRRGD